MKEHDPVEKTACWKILYALFAAQLAVSSPKGPDDYHSHMRWRKSDAIVQQATTTTITIKVSKDGISDWYTCARALFADRIESIR